MAKLEANIKIHPAELEKVKKIFNNFKTALFQAIDVIRMWHDFADDEPGILKNTFRIYFQNAPEMAAIRSIISFEDFEKWKEDIEKNGLSPALKELIQKDIEED